MGTQIGVWPEVIPWTHLISPHFLSTTPHWCVNEAKTIPNINLKKKGNKETNPWWCSRLILTNSDITAFQSWKLMPTNSQTWWFTINCLVKCLSVTGRFKKVNSLYGYRSTHLYQSPFEGYYHLRMTFRWDPLNWSTDGMWPLMLTLPRAFVSMATVQHRLGEEKEMKLIAKSCEAPLKKLSDWWESGSMLRKPVFQPITDINTGEKHAHLLSASIIPNHVAQSLSIIHMSIIR